MLDAPDFRARLTPCRFMQRTHLAPQRDADTVEVNWAGFRELLGVERGDVRTIKGLRSVEAGAFVGVAKGRRGPAPFVVYPRHGNDVGFVMRAHPGWRDRLINVYRVDAIRWGGAADAGRDRLGDENTPPRNVERIESLRQRSMALA